MRAGGLSPRRVMFAGLSLGVVCGGLMLMSLSGVAPVFMGAYGAVFVGWWVACVMPYSLGQGRKPRRRILARRFSLRAILSVLSGWMLCHEPEEVYDLMEYLTGQPVNPDAPPLELARKQLLRQFPQLKRLKLPPESAKAEEIWAWLEAQERRLGTEHLVRQG
ncbi:hypothetical protein [Calidithermus roseus]|uniref:DUF7736 domain-containing protein n=1 Tax=Calidithermus roseus TaxID=1644118 RepID=A0A399ELU9_9DEIN|nr:hypothetical protein [Calidithermus roseus]RIH84616.1 hypothetical protein Mrose_02553 [Calidithermus roseus]